MGVCMAVTTVHVKFVQGKTWDNVSVRCGLLLVKAAMMLGGKCGVMVYFCLVLQIYNFALIVNRRFDNNPGQSLPLQICFAYFTMHLYFLRTSHRDRMSSIKVGQVCPGYSDCSMEVHHILAFFDLTAPYIIGHLCLPLIVKARVRHVFCNQP